MDTYIVKITDGGTGLSIRIAIDEQDYEKLPLFLEGFKAFEIVDTIYEDRN